MNNKKIVLIGNGGVGKTTWVKSIYGNFDESYKPTLGVEVHPITYGDTRFNIWDTAGQEKFAGLRDGYYTGADYAIVMFDWSQPLTIKNIPRWVNDFKRLMPSKPVIIVGNKLELANDTSKQLLAQMGVPYISISARHKMNNLLPLMY